MSLRHICLMVFALVANPILAEPPDLSFKPAGDGLFEFDTGLLNGKLKLDGKYQGVYPLIDAETGADLVHPPGAFSLYRVFEAGKRYGNAARDWPTSSILLADGAVEVHWPPAEEHPLSITAVYRWSSPDTLDLEIGATPQSDMPRFELFMSSYFAKGFLARVYVRESGDAGSEPGFVSIDKRPQSQGGYVMFPRDEEAVRIIRDGRWKIPPNAVDWDIERPLAAPLVIRRDRDLGLTALMGSPPDDCFAIASPWNPATPEGGGYRSLYLSLFGRDLTAGQTARTRCRLTIARGISDQQAVKRYQEYLQGSAEKVRTSSGSYPLF